jgi:hypothetical protein
MEEMNQKVVQYIYIFNVTRTPLYVYHMLVKTFLNPVYKWANEVNRKFSKEKVQMASKHIKNSQHP